MASRLSRRAIVFSSSKLVASYHAAISASICGLFAKPFTGLSHSACRALPAGSEGKMPYPPPTSMCQPPWRGGDFCATRRARVPTSRAAKSTFMSSRLRRSTVRSPQALMWARVLRRHQGNGLARITAVREQPFGSLHVARTFEDIAAFLRVEWRAGRKIAPQGFPRTVVIPDIRAHVILLAQCHQDRAARPHVIEGREQVVHDKRPGVPHRVIYRRHQISILPQERQQVG